MQGTAFVRSPAKLNFHLEVQSKREDGFHSIVSLFQLIDLYDELTIRSLKVINVCRISGMPEVPLEDNIIFRAVDAFRRETGVTEGFQIDVTKRIPTRSGLGGGSSNAAYTLISLNRLCKTGLSKDRIAEIGAGLGSDVPFFCLAACAAVTGRGEVVRQLKPRTDLWCVVIVPEFSISTEAAYLEFDKQRQSNHYLSVEDVIKQYHTRDPRDWSFFNSFEQVLAERYPALAEIKKKLKNAGSHFSTMSGSGSSCFGIFLSRKDATHALKVLGKSIRNCWAMHSLDKIPDPVLQ